MGPKTVWPQQDNDSVPAQRAQDSQERERVLKATRQHTVNFLTCEAFDVDDPPLAVDLYNLPVPALHTKAPQIHINLITVVNSCECDFTLCSGKHLESSPNDLDFVVLANRH